MTVKKPIETAAGHLQATRDLTDLDAGDPFANEGGSRRIQPALASWPRLPHYLARVHSLM